ncbi:MAG: HAD family phosphatase [Clostridiales bacterium]|nr:HAD family phosphatase [Clostridiales bacterium]
MKRQDIRAVIFDQDGLMFDTERVSSEAWNLAGKEMGIHLEESFLSTIRGMNLEDAAARFREVFGEDFPLTPLRERKWEYVRQILRDRGVPVKAGLRELLEYLKENRYKIILATASSVEYTVNNLKEAGVEAYFDGMITGNMVSHAKPDPEIFLRAAELAGEDPANCLVLEDSLNGVAAGLAGGFAVIMVPDLTQPTPMIREQAAAVCSSLSEVAVWLEQRENQISGRS